VAAWAALLVVVVVVEVVAVAGDGRYELLV